MIHLKLPNYLGRWRVPVCGNSAEHMESFQTLSSFLLFRCVSDSSDWLNSPFSLIKLHTALHSDKKGLLEYFVNLLTMKDWNISFIRPFTNTLGNRSSLESWKGSYKLGTRFFWKFLLFFLAEPFKCSQGELRAIFRSLQRCYIGFRSGLWLGPPQDFSQSFFLFSLATPMFSWQCASGHCLKCVLLKCKLSFSLRSWTLWKRFSTDVCCVFFCNHGFSPPLSWPVAPSSLLAAFPPVCVVEKHPCSLMLPPPCWTGGMLLMRSCSAPAFLHTRRRELWPNSSILRFIRPEAFASHCLKVVHVPFWQTPSRLLCLLVEGFRLATLP